MHMTRVKPLDRNGWGDEMLAGSASDARQTMDAQYCTGHFPSFSYWISSFWGAVCVFPRVGVPCSHSPQFPG